MDTLSTENTHSTENLCDENSIRKKKKREKSKKSIVEDEGQTLDQNNSDTQLANGTAEGNVIIKKLKTKDKVQTVGQTKIDTELRKNLAEGNKTVQKPKVKDNPQIFCHTDVDIGPSLEDPAEGNATVKDTEFPDKVQHTLPNNMNTGPTVNMSEGNAIVKKTKKRRKIVKAEFEDEVQNKMDAESKENVAEGNVTTQNFSEGSVNVKRRKRRKTDMAKALEEIPRRMHAGSAENHAGVIVSVKISETRDEVQSMAPKVMDAEPAENISKGIATVENPMDEDVCQRMDKVKIDIGPAMDFTKEVVNEKRKRKRRSLKNTKDMGESTNQGGIMSSFSVHGINGLSQVSNENTLDEEIGHNEQISAISSCNAFTSKDEETLCLKPASVPSIRRKLLVLDLNGLLADIAYSHPAHCTQAIKISKRRSVLKRPFCHDFMKFCFENFDVGIWSSRSREIIDRVVDCLLGTQKHKLKFCWDATYCTQTGFKTLGKYNKPLVCKELRKIWENNDPNCPWKKGDYDKSNTLLLDDSPYKALLNPLHTAIFPHTYQYSYKKDNSLGPGGDLRVYLEGLITCEDVQKYVEQHPFGQIPITEKNASWGFYKKVMEQVSKPVTQKRCFMVQVSKPVTPVRRKRRN